MKRSAIKSPLMIATSAALILGIMGWRQVSGQSATTDWEKAAGGKMSFEIASVKQDTDDPTQRHSNFSLGPQNIFTPTGGLLSATNYPTVTYIGFAYKLNTPEILAVYAQLPKWADNDRYDIEARATGNPNKDQFRLMMQALLADRFKLAVHYETRQVPMFGLVLVKPGKLGPQLRVHQDDPPCPHGVPSTPGTPVRTMPYPESIAGGYPKSCAFGMWPSPSSPGLLVAGARDMSMKMIATSLRRPESGLDRPLIDNTGLSGNYDFFLEFAPVFNGPSPLPAPDPNAPTFLEAIEEQLGLKLEATTGPMDVLVIDHIEAPSPN